MVNRLIVVLILLMLGEVALGQKILGNPESIIYDIDIMEEQNLLIALQGRHDLELWDYKDEVLKSLFTTDENLCSVALDSAYVIAGSTTGKIILFSIKSKKQIENQSISTHAIKKILSIGRGRFLVSDLNGSIFNVNASLDSVVSTRVLPVDAISDFDFIKADNIVLLSNQNNIILFSITDFRIISSVKTQLDDIKSMRFDQKSNFIYLLSNGFRLYRFKFDVHKMSLVKLGRIRSRIRPRMFCVTDNLISYSSLSGFIRVDTPMLIYDFNIGAMLNDIEILMYPYPYISLFIASHGKGIILLNAADMKSKSDHYR